MADLPGADRRPLRRGPDADADRDAGSPRHRRATLAPGATATPGPDRAAREPERSRALRGRPVRPEREQHRARLARRDRRARAAAGRVRGPGASPAARPTPAGTPEPGAVRGPRRRRRATSGPPPATSCGSHRARRPRRAPRRVARLPPRRRHAPVARTSRRGAGARRDRERGRAPGRGAADGHPVRGADLAAAPHPGARS